MSNADSQVNATNLVNNDPLLKNLFISSGSTQDTFRAQSIGTLAEDGSRADIYSGVNWIKIPTLKDESNSNTATHISMLSVKTYTVGESLNIKTALRNKFISLSGYGDLTIWPNGLGQTPVGPYMNAIIWSSSAIMVDRSTPRPTSNSESNRTSRERRFLTPTTSYLFSTDLRWIVYKVPDKRYSATTEGATIQDGSSSSINPPVYVLLYNTMHRRNFQDVYVNMMRHSWNSQQGTRNDSCAGRQVAGCVDAAHDDTQFSTDYDSVHQTIVKYCNAFKEGNGGASGGRALRTYGDPSCAMVVDSRLATMNFIHRNNYTKDSLEVQYYGSKPAYETAYNLLVNKQSASVTTNTRHCVTNKYTNRPQQNDAIAFLREASGLVKSGEDSTVGGVLLESDSFMQQYVNHSMKFTNLYTIITDAQKLLPHTARTGLNMTTVVNNHSYNGYGCSEPNGLTIVECGISIDVGGSADITQNEFSQICGGEVQQMTESDHAALRAALAAYNAENRDSGLGSELFIYFIIIVAVLILVGAGLFFVLKKK